MDSTLILTTTEVGPAGEALRRGVSFVPKENTADAITPPRMPVRIDGREACALDDECRAQQDALYVALPPIKDAEDLLYRSALSLLERIRGKLAQDTEDASREGDAAPSSDAAQACLQLSKRLAPHIALAPRLKWAAFTEDDGGVSLVMQSLVTDRRINCRIRPDASAISAIRINEHMQAETIAVLLTDPDIGRELAEWVTKRV